MEFIKPMAEVIKRDKKQNNIFYQKTSYNKKIGDFKFIPFILERMLSTFLTLTYRTKVIRYPFNIETKHMDAELLQAINQHDELQQYDDSFFQLQKKCRVFIK